MVPLQMSNLKVTKKVEEMLLNCRFVKRHFTQLWDTGPFEAE